ncbi:DUF2798 domain-containing protein [Pseudomonas sp. GD03944]|uniref:DUF2798 domain-containing protein n=1 Tax=Pseudomonas sp. GD03944 TaxID=2975409 RepID=UPI00244C60F2|nr:DUF2798 domain-containing protein [Pseudomonas sp. GD03944]MDH1262035.1 DUF2798 domain-containing protein [Pseudomonas sp. GD03944]HWV10092.1 DUF2798 domain-containing protein [Pseudomonas sp.]
MIRLSRRHGHYLFGVVQSAITCAVAAAVASGPVFPVERFIAHWSSAWLVSWLMMVPVVLLIAPWLRRLVDRLTDETRP